MSLKDIVSLPEYTGKLPSGKEVKFRPFVVKEEKLLLMAKESKDETIIYDCIKKIIKNCVIEPKNLDIDKMVYYDVQHLFVLLRCRSMGEAVQIQVTDPETKQIFQTEMDLEKIVLENMSENPKKIKLNNNLAIQFKYPKFLDFSKIKKTNEIKTQLDTIDVLLNFISITIDKVYTGDRTINCETEKQEDIVEFVNSLSKSEFEQLCEFFKNMPVMKYKSKFKNPITNKEFDVEVTDFSNFFIL
jgi:hypothetical protein